MNIYGISCILTIDHQKKQNLIISTDSNKIVLPITKIEYPRLLFNEIRYDIQQMFDKNESISEILKDMNFAYTDIQNELLIKHIENLNDNKFDINNDIFILVAFILNQPYKLSKYTWKTFDFLKSIEHINTLNSLIDFIIEKTIV